MNLWTIIVIVVAICGLVWVFPKLPSIAQIILAIVVAIACLIVLLNAFGVPVGLTL
jgi:hypothetical protein